LNKNITSKFKGIILGGKIWGWGLGKKNFSIWREWGWMLDMIN
jgi:hypothetical protein